MKKLSNVNNFMKKIEEADNQIETDIVLSGPDAIKNILVSETIKLSKLQSVSNELLSYLTDSKVIKQLSYKEKQNLFNTISNTENNSRDFIFRVAELANKNAFLQEVLKLAEKPKDQIITSENGETYITTIDDETRRNLSEIIRDVINDRVINT
jgi:hypothetical protein